MTRKLVTLTTIAGVLFALPARADPVPRGGLFCDTAEQLEEVIMAVEEAGTPRDAAVEAVNKKSEKENACLPMRGFAEDVEIVKTVHTNGKYLGIMKVVVVGVMSPMGPQPVPPMVQYIAILSPKKDVSI